MFFSSFKVAIFVGVSFSLPVISHHIYYFLEPGLTKRESKILKPIMLAAPALFFVGLVFAYFLVLPPLLEFLLGFNQDVIEARYGIQYFLDLCISLLIVTGITFQLPIVLFSLNWFKIIKPSYLIKIWRYVVLGAFLLSAVITPTPDPLTMSILASALLVLYFGTYLILRIFGKN
jgi:sec-independent protein translocase protein TatC